MSTEEAKHVSDVMQRKLTLLSLAVAFCAGPGGSGLGDSQRGQAYGDIALNSMLGGSG